MGQTITTPLSLTLDHWRDVQRIASNQSVDVKKRRWVTFCSAEWPTFNVGWPQDGTFNKDIITQVKIKVFSPGPHGHPDQVPYIVTWEAIAYDPPPWAKPFVHPQLSVSPSAPSAFSHEVSGPPTRSSLYPALTPTKSPSPKTQVLSDDGGPLIDLLSDDPPPYRGPENQPPAGPPDDHNAGDAASTSEGAPEPSPMASRLRGRREHPAADSTTSQAFPLRTGGNGQLQYWPFSSADLYNWKNNNPSFSEDPGKLTALIESVLITHQPTWDDCQQLLGTLLTGEEKQRVLLEARKAVRGDDGRPTQLPNEINDAFPLERPDWDYTTPAGRNHLVLYRQLLLAGLQHAGRSPTNLAKVKGITQGPNESPSAFLERLKEAYRRYTPYDPEDPGQETNVSMSFIWQSAPDIGRKLERLEDLKSKTLGDLVREAERIFNKRETPEEREERIRRETEEKEERRRAENEQREKERDRRRHREMSKLLATVVSGQRQDRQGGERRRPQLDKDQCAYCKEKGHWAKDCPKKPRGPRGPRPQTSLLTLDD
nr:putative gag polyprotein [Murine leukemia virus]